jgi:hypothetical protein
MRPTIRLFTAIAGVVLLASGAATAQTDGGAAERRVGGYRVRIAAGPPKDDLPVARLEIRRGDKLVIGRDGEPGEQFFFEESVPAGADVTGRGVPDVVVDH